MALQIPQQPIDSRVDLPPVPQNPPTLSDINQAMIYKRMPVVIDSARSNHINASSPEDVGRAAVYEHNVTKACVAGFAEAAAPAWFKPVQVQSNNMQDKFENMCQWVEIQRSHLYFQADRKGNRD